MKYISLFKPALLGVSLLFTNPFLSGAQKADGGHFTFAWGEEYELPKRHEDLGFIGNAQDGYIQVSHDARESMIFQKFDNKLHLTGEKEVALSNLPRGYGNELITELGNSYYWFFSTWDRGEDKEALYAQEIDVKKGTFKGNAREIASTSKISLEGDNFVWGYGARMLYNQDNGKWNFSYSFDHSKLLVQYRKKPERRNDRFNNDVIGFSVFDDQMHKLWEREIRMPYTEEMMDNEDYSIDSRGNVYMLAKVYDEKRSRDRKRPNHHFEILKWSADKEDVTIIPFRFTDKFVNSAYVTEDGNGDIIVGGYYTNQRNSGSTDGVFLLKLDRGSNEMKKVMKGVYPFPASVMQQYESARTRRRMQRKEEKGEAEDAHLMLRSIVLKQDGSIQLFGEESYVVVQRSRTGGYVAGFGYSSMGGPTNTTYIYHYNDIMAMEIGADGEMKWVKKIPKSQTGGAGIGGMSFKSFNYKDDTYFFFMDNKKNLDIEKDETPAEHRDGLGGIMMAVRIDRDGKMKKNQVFDVREDKLNLTVSKFNKVDFNQMIVRGRARRRDSHAALVTFE